MRVLVVGNASLSDLVLQAAVSPGSSSVSVLKDSPGARGNWVPGGAATTIALAVRALGHEVALCHPLAADPAERTDLSELATRGIDLSRSPQIANPSGRCVIVYGDNGRFAWSTPPAPDAVVDTAEALDGIDYVVVAPVWSELSKRIVSEANRQGIPCAMVGEFAQGAHEADWDTVIVDKAQRDNAARFATGTLVVTDGEAGSTVAAGGESFHVPALSIEPVDPTGAGDTYGGTFIAARLAGKSLREAAELATETAARCCLGYGSWAAFTGVPAAPLRHEVSQRDRVLGALWGTACGDAFGMPNSFLKQLPWLTEMVPGPANSPYHAGYPAGRITDDTEQAMALTEALLAGFTPEIVAEKLNEWFVSVGGESSLAVGPSTKRAMLAFARGEDVRQIGKFGVTNGSAMRVAPIGVVAGLRGLTTPSMIDLVETSCIPTHFTSPAISGAGAIAGAIAAALSGASWDEVIAAALSGANEGETRGNWIYAPSIAERIKLALSIADRGVTPEEFTETISLVVGTGEPCTESVPAAIAAAHFAGGNPALAIELCANSRGDTDTTAAMAGGICGAFAGFQALPEQWRTLVGKVNKLDVVLWADKLEQAAK
jgi:ADP-ribosylglycohydrolase/sugar/nucleoside kinase (ribokinase family)